jgi:hypothetical protein
MNTDTQPPSKTEQETIAKFEASIRDYESLRRSGESGLMRALAISWGMNQKAQAPR